MRKDLGSWEAGYQLKGWKKRSGCHESSRGYSTPNVYCSRGSLAGHFGMSQLCLLQDGVCTFNLGGVAVPKPVHSGKSRPWGVCEIPNKDGVSLPFELVASAGKPPTSH